MSVRVLSKVLRESVSTGAPRLVLIALADVASDTGEVSAYKRSQAILAAKANVSPSTVRKAIRTLEEMGEVRVITVGDGRNSSDYQIILPGLGEVQIGGQGGPDRRPEPSPDRRAGGSRSAPHHSVSSVVSPTSLSVAAFDDFWDVYPKRKGRERGSKGKAQAEWAKLTLLEHERAVWGAKNYAAGQDPQFVKDAFRWLHDRLFDDWQQTPEKPMTAAERVIARVHAEEAARPPEPERPALPPPPPPSEDEEEW